MCDVCVCGLRRDDRWPAGLAGPMDGHVLVTCGGFEERWWFYRLPTLNQTARSWLKSRFWSLEEALESLTTADD